MSSGGNKSQGHRVENIREKQIERLPHTVTTQNQNYRYLLLFFFLTYFSIEIEGTTHSAV